MSRWPISHLLSAADLTTTRVGAFVGARPYVSTGDVHGTAVIASESVTFTDRPSRADVMAKAGDVLFARMQATNKVIVVNNATANHLWSTGFAALRPNVGTNPDWLGYWLASSFFNERKDSLCTGATQKAITNEGIRELEIPLPPLAEQERMVRILDEADALRRLRLDADTRSERLIEILYLRTFCQAENRHAWTVGSINDVAEQRDGSIRTGPFGSQLLHSEFVETGVPVLGIENVVTNDFRWTAPRCLPLAKYRRFERFRVFPGDVLVTIMGTVGRCCVAPDDVPVCMSTKHLCVITPDRTKVHPRFLWAALLFDPAIRQQTALVGSGAIMEGWNSTIIRQLTLHVPPLALQNEFAKLTAEARELEAVQFASRRRLDDLFQSLLHRAFQGGL